MGVLPQSIRTALSRRQRPPLRLDATHPRLYSTPNRSHDSLDGEVRGRLHRGREGEEVSSEASHRVVLTVETEDPEDQTEAVASLAQDVSRLDIDRVDTAGESAPAGAKSAGGLATQVVITLASGVVPLVVAVVSDWLSRRRERCKILLEIGEGVSVEVSAMEDIDKIMEQLRELGFDPPER